MFRPDSFSVWAWKAAVAAFVGAMCIAAVLLAATLMGISDPPHLGTLTIDETFANKSDRQIIVNAGDAQTHKVLAATIACPCTIELRMVQLSGPTDSGYGLWWGEPDHSQSTLAGANSDGYLAVFQGDPAAGVAERDWQLFPHVRALGEANTFWVDITVDTTTVRLNDEVAMSFDTVDRSHMSAGYFVRASAAGAGTFQLVSFKAWETTTSGK